MSTYSNLAIELIGTGEQDGTWGTTTNVNLGTALEEAIVGTVDQAVTASNLTLTLSNSNATQVARHLRLRLTGSAGGASNLLVPELSGGKNYYIINASNTAVTVKTSADGILVPAGKSMALYQTGVHSGTNYEVVEAANYSNSYTIQSVDINGGTIDSTTIGAGTPSTGAFTTLSGISTGSVPSLEAKGTSGVTSGYLELNCSENSHAIKLLGPPHSASANYTLTFPNNDGDAGQFLQSNGSGVLTWAAASGTPFSTDIVVNDLTVGKGNGSVATSTALGVTALQDITGANNTAIGYEAMKEATSASSSVAVGREALGAGVLTGAGNTGLGYTAGKVVTSGAYNTLAGHKAGLALTTGTSNTFIGNEAGDEQTGSVSNTCIGDQAGQKHTAGYSVMIGSLAGQYATSATSLIAIGRQAGQGGSSGSFTGNYNVLIGTTAGALMTTAHSTTITGHYSGDAITSGVANNIYGYASAQVATTPDGTCCFGNEALVSLTTGNANDCLGVNALYVLTTGYDNVAIGQASGTAINTGYRNTAIGHESGQVMTTGSNNTFLGYAAVPSAATVSNEMTLGNSAVNKVRMGDGTLLFGGGNLRAWVNFNGTGTVAIRAHNNVSSIGDNGTGDYTVNFATNISDVNYAVNITAEPQSGNASHVRMTAVYYNTRAVGSVRVRVGGTATEAGPDAFGMFVTVFR